MAEANTEKKVVKKEDLVEVYIPKLSKDDMYQIVIINGKRTDVIKGEFVEVPRSVGEAIKNSLKLKKESEMFAIREIQKASKKAE